MRDKKNLRRNNYQNLIYSVVKKTVFIGYLESSSIIENRKVEIWLFLAKKKKLIFSFPSTCFLVDIRNEA